MYYGFKSLIRGRESQARLCSLENLEELTLVFTRGREVYGVPLIIQMLGSIKRLKKLKIEIQNIPNRARGGKKSAAYTIINMTEQLLQCEPVQEDVYEDWVEHYDNRSKAWTWKEKNGEALRRVVA